MMGAARCGALLLAVALMGQMPVDPQIALLQYATALLKAQPPANVTFVYSVEQSGSRNIEEVHRVYRSGSRKRDETLSVDGIAYKQPRVRVVTEPDRYELGKLAPTQPAYTFTFSGMHDVEGARVYVFRTDIQSAGSFAVTSVAIDATHFLPREIRFSSARGAAKGMGRIVFGPEGRYWMPREASVQVRDAAGKISREKITWSKYGFPESLPSSTFLAPQAPPTPAP